MTTIITSPVVYVIFFILLVLTVAFVIGKWPTIEGTIGSAADSPSQKRLVIFMFSVAIVITTFAVVFLKATVPEFVWYGLLGVVVAGLGLTAWEKVNMKKIDAEADKT